MDVVGHDRLVDRFRRSASRGRLAGSFLFVGPEGVGKRRLAVQLAQSLLCETTPEESLTACGSCSACQQVAARTHPDLEMIAKPPERAFIPIELFVGDREHRMREGLCHNISLKPFRGGRKVAIIDDADYLNQEGANCLLKTLEEPPPKSLIILIGTSEQRQLPTIRSRCQVVRFAPLSAGHLAELAQANGLAASNETAQELSALAAGSLARAAEFADPAQREMRSTLLDLLAGQSNLAEAARDVTGFVEAAGKEAPARRQRLRQIVDLAIQFYRQLLGAAQGREVEGDGVLRQAAHRAHQTNYAADAILACLDRCLDARAQIEANANQATLIECWLDDLLAFRPTASE